MRSQLVTPSLVIWSSGVMAQQSIDRLGGFADWISIGQHDPWTWIIGSFGAAVVYVKYKPNSKADAVINGFISVMIGGLVSPYLATYLGDHYDKSLSNPYPLAFLLSAFWPWVVPFVIRRVRMVVTGREEKKRDEEDSRYIEAMDTRRHNESVDQHESRT